MAATKGNTMSSLEYGYADHKPKLSIASTSISSSDTLPPYTSHQSSLCGETLTFQATNWLKTNISITSSLGNQRYSLTYHRLKEPDLRLHLGSEEGSIAAAACIKSWSRTYHIGLVNDKVANAFTANGSDIKSSESLGKCFSDQVAEDSMTWIKAKTAWCPKAPTWTYGGLTYVLKRTHVDENGDRFEKARWRSYFGVYDEGSKVVALYEPGSCWGAKTARLRFAEGVSDGLEMCIVLAVCCWREEMRRAG